MTLAGIIRTIKDPWHLVIALSQRGLLDRLSDETYLKLNFRAKLGKSMNLKDPQTFNEKLQWLKLYDRKPIYTTMVDKYEVKKYVAGIIGEEYIIPTFGVWDKFEDIDFDSLPNQFVLKTTHDSGGVVICRDKTKMFFSSKEKNGITVDEVRSLLENSLKRNYYWSGREWPYKNIKHRIIAEQLLMEEDGVPARDYKVLCFNSEPKLMEIILNRFTDEYTQDFYTDKWEKIDLVQNNTPKSDIVLEKPQWLGEILDLSRKLSKGIPHLRCDWYYVGEKFYIGELTFFEASGLAKYSPAEWDYTMGSWITLPDKTEERI